jgi:two-component system CheB/CheR fusion protein
MSHRQASQAKASAAPLGARSPPPQAGLTIVAIGASAGGLEACRKLLNCLPAPNGMAFILVQHLDPTHDSLIVELLKSHTAMRVCQAEEGMQLEADRLTVIPPGAYLSVRDGTLHLSPPQARHGTRMPFDFLLRSLAEGSGRHAICVVLSGTGADGTLGLVAIKEHGGLVIVQDPAEAANDGMPRSAIATGMADLVLPISAMPRALLDHASGLGDPPAPLQDDSAEAHLRAIIDILRGKTAHNFTQYKAGTLRRRIERRVAIAGLPPLAFARYLDMLRSNEAELELLANDLLINVTSFFRDPKVFARLRETLVPAMVAAHGTNHPLRVWVIGCSTGEEAYSLAIVFREALAAANSTAKLEIFASDADAAAVAIAREGRYGEAIEADISPARLAAFFRKEGRHYRVSPELRAGVVFTVQDILTDAPFSRMDMVSCRNLLIYLQPVAQAKVLTVLHFALREDGILLLGNAETASMVDDRFAVISKQERLYRRIGRVRPDELGFLFNAGNAAQARPGVTGALPRQSALAELCRGVVMEHYVPASVLINAAGECLFTFGATDRYLHVPPGAPTRNLFELARPDLRGKLRAAISQAHRAGGRLTVPGGRVTDAAGEHRFNFDLLPATAFGEKLLLICFVDAPAENLPAPVASNGHNVPRVAALERELAATRLELQGAVSNLEIITEEQNAVNEEALSVQQEYQATNEELLTSKEELQSLNEELTALNGQLQETLDRQRTTANDLQNVLYSTNVATVFLDPDLRIRFFTPATRALFNVIPSDIGRPLADLTFFAADASLLNDAHTVLRTLVPMECEIDTRAGNWYMRRILPYRTQDEGVEGVVILFSDVTERHAIADALRTATRQAELANLAKSRFLAAASHDLRQPLQTLTLLQSLLASTVQGNEAQALVVKLDDMLGAMSVMLNTLLDINQIEAGTVQPVMTRFPINDLLTLLQEQFTYHAAEKGVSLRVIPCGLIVESDPRLLEQMMRNLLSNALKYTKRGRVLLGCRRHGDTLNVEVWDTGVGIPASELNAIFDEYHQLDNPARERSRGLGLGLSIVQRLADLLQHRLQVRSRVGRGSVFTIEVRCPLGSRPQMPIVHDERPTATVPVDAAAPPARILIIEDDPEVRGLLETLLRHAGYATSTAASGLAALDLVAHGGVRPNLIVADYNLPGGMHGLQIVARLREQLHLHLPSIILTGDISTATLRDVKRMNCTLLNKPVKMPELMQVIGDLLAASAPAPQACPLPPAEPARADVPVIYVIDDDPEVCRTLCTMLQGTQRTVVDFATSEAFLAAPRPAGVGCLLVDACLPGMSGIELLRRLQETGDGLPAIVITGNSDVAMAVDAMKAGAVDFIEKPVGQGELLASIDRALTHARDSTQLAASRDEAARHLVGLSERQRQVMDMVLAGDPSKNIAADLGISRRTVENHRAAIMRRTGAKSLPALARLALAAAARGQVGG